MKILVADDDRTSRLLLQRTLERWGQEVTIAGDGQEAWTILQASEDHDLAILDWMMPHLDGLEVCRRLRATRPDRALYLVLLTARNRSEDLIAGLEAGADDYVTKPFDEGELRARLRAASRLIALQRELAQRVRELEEALSRVAELHGLLPICSYCKRIRDDGNYWHQVESYVSDHSAATFTHGICPECTEKVMRPQLEDLRRRRAEGRKEKDEDEGEGEGGGS